MYLLLGLFMLGCATTQLTDSWRNPEYQKLNPNNVLVVGLTDNTTGRMLYEDKLTGELNKRGINASQSALVFNNSFKNIKQTEEDIDNQIDKLLDLGFNTVIVSAVKGVDEHVSYSEGFPETYYYYRRFGRYYYLYQDVYFEPGYYNKYNVYHIETSIYDLKSKTKKSLIWVGSYDIVNPQNISKTVDNYVKAILTSLESEGLI